MGKFEAEGDTCTIPQHSVSIIVKGGINGRIRGCFLDTIPMTEALGVQEVFVVITVTYITAGSVTGTIDKMRLYAGRIRTMNRFAFPNVHYSDEKFTERERGNFGLH